MKRALLLLMLSCTKPDATPAAAAVPDASAAKPSGPKVLSVGPRLISNQTKNPLSVRGEGLKTGMTLTVGNIDVPLVALDEKHAYGRMNAGCEFPSDQMQGLAEVKLDGAATGLKLKVVNDTAFPELFGIAVNGSHGYVTSVTEDAVYVIGLESNEVFKVAVGDGPTAIAAWKGGAVVAHRFDPRLAIVDFQSDVAFVPGPANAAALLVDQDIAYVAEHARDSVAAIDLNTGKEVWRASVAPNPGALAMTSAGLAVGSQQTGEVEWLDPKTGKALSSTQPGPKTQMLGPPTIGGDGPGLAQYTMNGSMVRALAFGAKGGRLFTASIGPNIGPNPKKMEVSMNGGVAAIELPKTGTPHYLRHLGFGAGLTQALVLDDARGLLYGADVALGLVRVLDAKKLSGKSPADAEKAVVQELAIPPPPQFPFIRPEEDFAVKGRAGVALHSGPAALALSDDQKALYVLNRFTGTVARIDVTKAAQKGASLVKQYAVTPMLAQRSRRLGEILYFTDLGRTAVTCDACHPDGHTGGVMFEKTSPLRIYRSGTIRGGVETAPYFTPASTFSMGMTAKFVMERNRYSNPTPTLEELEQVTQYASAIVTLPNPFVDENGAPPEELALPDGHVSHPRKGLALFEGKAECASCHPAPQFTVDQDDHSSKNYLDVGTPHLTPLREELQDPTFKGFGVPALVGSWDVFPMLTTGSAGLKVQDDALVVGTRFPLRPAVVDWAPKHGRADQLTPEEVDDLLGYVQSL